MNKFKEKENKKLYNYYKNKVNILSGFRLLVFVLGVISFIIASSYNYFMYIGFLFILLFIILIIVHDVYYKKLDYYKKKLEIISEYQKRFNGKWREFEDYGDDYNNDLLNDLDIIGKNSLFQYLSICSTLDGRDKLISKLSNKNMGRDKLLKNQEAIEELSKNIDFVVDFQIALYDYRNKSVNLKDGFKYFDKNVGDRIIDFVIGIMFSLFSFLLLVLGLFKILPVNFFYAMFIFNFFINYMYSFIFSEDFENISFISNNYEKLSNVFNIIISNNFNSSLLNNIYRKVNKSKASVNKLVIINDLNNFKSNILSSFIFNGLFCINIVVMYLYSIFQKSNSITFKNGIEEVSELEALISLAGIGIVRDDVIIPEFVDDVLLDFDNIKHPLIDIDKCVGNDFKGHNGINIITGSNMGGKTSFLRTIGINLILMNAGGFVCSKSFRSCYFKIFTSMRISDDIDKGISTFYAELLRIKKALDYDEDNRLVLVDEIFKGTNYNDRIYGAINVIEKLNDKKTIAFITTHDFELCDVKINNIENYFVKEYYEDDNIKFDYKIRHGKCDSTNAKYLMKKLGIIDK